MTTPIPGNTSNGSGSGTSLTISHTVPSASNLLLVSFGYQTASSTPTVTATYNGVAMTQLGGVLDALHGQCLFYLLAPTAGTANVIISISQSIASSIAIVSDYSSANIDSGLTFDVVSTLDGGGTSNTLSPIGNTTIDPDLIYASSLVLSATNQTPTNSQTELADITTTGLGIVAGYKTAIGVTTPIGWSWASAGQNVLIAVAIRPKGIAVIAPSADTMMIQDTATTNYDTSVNLDIGEASGTVSIRRAWVKPDFTGMPADAILASAAFMITPTSDDSANARTMTMARCLRAVVSGQMTYNVYSTGNSWGTAGAHNTSTDYDSAVSIGTMAVGASPTLNSPMTMTLLANELQKFKDGTYTNNGVLLFVNTESSDFIRYASTNHATPEYRPRFVYQYSVPSNGGFFAWF